VTQSSEDHVARDIPSHVPLLDGNFCKLLFVQRVRVLRFCGRKLSEVKMLRIRRGIFVSSCKKRRIEFLKGNNNAGLIRYSKTKPTHI